MPGVNVKHIPIYTLTPYLTAIPLGIFTHINCTPYSFTIYLYSISCVFFSKSLRILYICMYSTINNYPLNQVHTPAVKKKMAANSPGHAIKLCTFVFIAYISIYMGVIVCSKRRRVNNCA